MSEDNKPRIFLSTAYLVEVEPKTFGLYRNLMKEEKDATGHPVQEKLGKPLGPLGLFRECEGDEQPDLTTFHPVDKRPLNLKSLSQPEDREPGNA